MIERVIEKVHKGFLNYLRRLEGKMNKVLQATEAMFDDHLDGDVANALLEPVSRDSKLVSIMTREKKERVQLLDDISKQLGVSRSSFLSMALDDAINAYQAALFEKGINDATKFPTMRGFNPEEDV